MYIVYIGTSIGSKKYRTSLKSNQNLKLFKVLKSKYLVLYELSINIKCIFSLHSHIKYYNSFFREIIVICHF